MFWHLHQVSKEWYIIVGKTTWNAPKIIKTKKFQLLGNDIPKNPL
jgi:hypothetical protein